MYFWLCKIQRYSVNNVKTRKTNIYICEAETIKRLSFHLEKELKSLINHRTSCLLDFDWLITIIVILVLWIQCIQLKTFTNSQHINKNIAV